MTSNGDSRWHAMDVVAIALRTAHQLVLQLGFKSAGILEPPFKPVIVLAIKVVDDHVFIRGARDGNRTRTLKEREILSLLCLPISPPGLGASNHYIGARYKKRESDQRFPFSIWSGRRVSNSRPIPWQGIALPTELLPR